MTQEEYETRPAPNVIVALSRVIRDMPGIKKDSQSAAAQGGYAYRGIEAITREAAPLFAKHGIVFVPKVVQWDRDQITVANKPWTDDRLLTTYRVYGPGGAEDFIEVGPIPSVGRDNSDKGTNKALTQAFKYALIQTLCIGDSKDDADGQTFERDTAPEMATVGQRKEVLERLSSLGRYPLTWIEENLPDRKNMNILTAEDYKVAVTLLEIAEKDGDVEQAAEEFVGPGDQGGHSEATPGPDDLLAFSDEPL